jgi:uncharacterized protein
MTKKLENVSYVAAEGKPGRTIVARLKPGSDLVNSLKQICADYDVKNGFISSCIGSLFESKFIFGMPDDSLKSKAGFSPEQQTFHLTEFLSGQGTICHDDNNQVLIHFHGIFCDKGFLRGGHFDQPGNIVGTTMELEINEVLGVEMTRPLDQKIDQNHLHAAEKLKESAL